MRAGRVSLWVLLFRHSARVAALRSSSVGIFVLKNHAPCER